MEEVFSLKIDSRLENISQVESLIETIKVQYAINEEQYGNMLLASVEAVTNAIEHGNLGDVHKVVEIEASREKSEVKLCIRDEGSGFNPDQLPDPTTPERREQPDGRGVFLIRKLADKVFFRDGGSCVEMRFQLS